MDHQPACPGLDDTTTSEQCVTFGFYPQLTLPSVCIPTSGRAMSSEKMYETAEKKKKRPKKQKKNGLWCYFCGASVSLHCGVITAHRTVMHTATSAERMKRPINHQRHSGGDTTTFNGNTLQKIATTSNTSLSASGLWGRQSSAIQFCVVQQQQYGFKKLESTGRLIKLNVQRWGINISHNGQFSTFVPRAASTPLLLFTVGCFFGIMATLHIPKPLLCFCQQNSIASFKSVPLP